MNTRLSVGRFLLIAGLILAIVAVLMVLYLEGDSYTHWAAAIGVPGLGLLATSMVVLKT